MDDRFEARGSDGLTAALCEGTALIDRLGACCFTGDSRLLPCKALKPLLTSESIQRRACRSYLPDVLDLPPKHGVLNIAK